MMLWIRCPVCAANVSTGVEIYPAALAQLPEQIDGFRCNVCGQQHRWQRRNAWLVDAYLAPPVLSFAAPGRIPQRVIVQIARRKPSVVTATYTVH
jgi:hypothetical protein